MELYNPAMGILLLTVLLVSAAMLMVAFAVSFIRKRTAGVADREDMGSWRGHLWRGFTDLGHAAPDIGIEGRASLLR